MKSILIALLLGAVAPAAAPAANSPPLCRAEAHVEFSIIPWLANITVSLRPGCPKSGRADVRLLSDIGSTDPADEWLTLTPCLKGDEGACTVTWHGVVLRPLNWHPQWRARNGRAYDIPIQQP